MNPTPTAGVRLTVGGVVRSFRPDSLSIVDRIGERSELSLEIVDRVGDLLIPYGTLLTLAVPDGDGILRIAATGSVHSSRRKLVADVDGITARYVAVTVADLHTLFDGRRYAEGFEDTTAGDVLLDVLATIGRSENLYAHPYPGAAVAIAGANLLGYWRLADGEGDESYRAGNGTPVGSPAYSGLGSGSPVADTHLGGYVALSGSDAVTTGAGADDLPASSGFTVGAYVRTADGSAGDTLTAVACANTSTFSGGTQDLLFALRRDGAAARWTFSVMTGGVGGVVWSAVDVTAAPDDTWISFAGTFKTTGADTGAVSLYRDGVLVAQTATPFDASGLHRPASNPAVELGQMADALRMDGSLAEVLYVGRALDSDEVADLHRFEGETLRVADGPTITRISVSYAEASEVAEQLAELAGFEWHVDPYRTVHFHARGAACCALPASITDGILAGTVVAAQASPGYRNTQYIRGGRDRTDQQVDTIVADGESRAFTVSYPLVAAPTVEVEDGVAAGTYTAVTVGTKGSDTVSAFLFAKGDPVLASLDTDTPIAAGLRVRVTYIGEYDVIVIVGDANEQNEYRQIALHGSGRVEDLTDDPSVEDRAQGFQLAAATIEKFKLRGGSVTFVTRTAGLRAGQVGPLALPALDFDETVLIEQVEIYDDATELRYAVSAVSGPAVLSWARLLAEGVRAGRTVVDRVNIGRAEIVSILVPAAETTYAGETVDIVAYACPVLPVTVPFTVC
jgi:hypothetical protein